MSGRTLAAIRRQIVREWPHISARARTIRVDCPKSPTLLGSSTKVRKGPALYSVAVIYMSPDREAMLDGDTRTMCPLATPECSATCLGHSSGLLAMPEQKVSRLWKTALYLGARRLWRELLHAEIDAHERRCVKHGRVPVVRVDGSSDTGEGLRAAPSHPGVTFYDYTKVSTRALATTHPANYRVAFSWSGVNATAARMVLAAGGTVAVVFDAKPGRKGTLAQPIPETFLGARVIDGDADDLRFLDPRGVVIGLRFKAAKGRAAALARARVFVVRVAEACRIAA